MQNTTNTVNDKSWVHPATHGGGALWEQGLQHHRNDHAFGSGQTARTEPPPRKESTRARSPCCDKHRIAPLQSGLLICKRSDRRVYRIPIGSTRIGQLLTFALCALLIGYKLREQRLHRGQQVVGVGLGCATRASLIVRLTGRFPADVALVCILKTPNREMRILCSPSLKPPIFCRSRHQ